MDKLVIIFKNWPNDMKMRCVFVSKGMRNYLFLKSYLMIMRMSLRRFDVLGMIFKTLEIVSNAWDSTLVEMLNSCVWLFWALGARIEKTICAWVVVCSFIWLCSYFYKCKIFLDIRCKDWNTRVLKFCANCVQVVIIF